MKTIGDFLISLLYVAGIFVLVRPGSQGPSLVSAITSGTASLVDSATGGGGWAAGMSGSGGNQSGAPGGQAGGN